MQGAGTESSDSTLAEGRAALDVVTRITLLFRKGVATPFPAYPARDDGVKGAIPLAGLGRAQGITI